MAKLGGLLKLDAICAKLKTNLKSGTDAETDQSNNGNEPNNNTRTLELVNAKTGTLSNGCHSNDGGHYDDDVRRDLVEPANHEGSGSCEDVTNQDGAGESLANQDGAEKNLANQDGAGKSLANQDGGGKSLANQDRAEKSLANQDGAGKSLANQDGAGETLANQELSGSCATVVKAAVGRKSRRKAKNPRNIANIAAEECKDDLAEYEENNQDVDFSSVCEAAMEEGEEEEETEEPFRHYDEDPDSIRHYDEDPDSIRHYDENPDSINEDSRLDMNSDSEDHMTFGDKSHDQLAYTVPPSGGDDDCGVLDLSVAKPGRKRPIEEDSESDSDEEIPREENGALDLTTSRKSAPSGKRRCGGEEAEIKHYAEDTMNELLSMYGLDGGESLADRITLNNFTPTSILRGSPPRPGSRPQGFRPQVPGSQTAQRHLDPEILRKMGLDLGDDSDGEDLAAHSPGKSLSERYLTSESYVKACLSGSSLSDLGSPTRIILPDYQKYLKRFTSHKECGGNHCEDMGYKEHFHCMDCSFRVFIKKKKVPTATLR